MVENQKTTNLGRIGDARLDLVPALALCDPGMEPTEYNVIVAPAEAAKTIGTKGLLIAPDQTRENTSLAMQVGRIVAASPIAFNYDKWPAGSTPPKVGQIIWYARYAGGVFEGRDGREYRIVKDKDIGAIIPEVASSALKAVG